MSTTIPSDPREFHDTMTLIAARDRLRELASEGATCPCCAQYAKVYTRVIHTTMARALIVMYRSFGSEWGKLSTVLDRTLYADSAKLRYWGLIEAMPESRRDDGSNRTGWWRVTPRGGAFVRAEISVPKEARIYDERCLGVGGEPVTIIDCLGTKFNYRDLMEGR